MLEIRRAGGATEKISVTRAATRLSSVEGLQSDDSGKWNFWLDREQKLAYVRITDFSKQVPDLMQTTLKELLEKGLKGMVLDLRHCPGGLLASATGVAHCFLREGTIVSVKGEHTSEQVLRAMGKNYLGDFPLLVLIDEHTASAAARSQAEPGNEENLDD